MRSYCVWQYAWMYIIFQICFDYYTKSYILIFKWLSLSIPPLMTWWHLSQQKSVSILLCTWKIGNEMLCIFLCWIHVLHVSCTFQLSHYNKQTLYSWNILLKYKVKHWNNIQSWHITTEHIIYWRVKVFDDFEKAGSMWN